MVFGIAFISFILNVFDFVVKMIELDRRHAFDHEFDHVRVFGVLIFFTLVESNVFYDVSFVFFGGGSAQDEDDNELERSEEASCGSEDIERTDERIIVELSEIPELEEKYVLLLFGSTFATNPLESSICVIVIAIILVYKIVIKFVKTLVSYSELLTEVCEVIWLMGKEM